MIDNGKTCAENRLSPDFAWVFMELVTIAETVRFHRYACLADGSVLYIRELVSDVEDAVRGVESHFDAGFITRSQADKQIGLIRWWANMFATHHDKLIAGFNSYFFTEYPGANVGFKVEGPFAYPFNTSLPSLRVTWFSNYEGYSVTGYLRLDRLNQDLPSWQSDMLPAEYSALVSHINSLPPVGEIDHILPLPPEYGFNWEGVEAPFDWSLIALIGGGVAIAGVITAAAVWRQK